MPPHSVQSESDYVSPFYATFLGVALVHDLPLLELGFGGLSQCSDPRISDGSVSYDDRHLSLPAPSAGSSPLIQGLGAWSDGQSAVEPFPELSGVAAADGELSEISPALGM